MIRPTWNEFPRITLDPTPKDPIFSSPAVDRPRGVPPLDRETAVRIEEVQRPLIERDLDVRPRGDASARAG